MNSMDATLTVVEPHAAAAEGIRDLWAVVQPLLAMLILTAFFGRPAQLPSEGVPYPLFAYAGLLAWTFFANALFSSSNSIAGAGPLITKIYFPRLLIPI